MCSTSAALGPGLLGQNPIGKPHYTDSKIMALGRDLRPTSLWQAIVTRCGARAQPLRPKSHRLATRWEDRCIGPTTNPNRTPGQPPNELGHLRAIAMRSRRSVDAQFAATALTHQLRQTPKHLARTRPLGPGLSGQNPIGKAQVEPTPTQCDTGMLLLTMP